MRVPEHMTVLDFQHLAEPATRFERADDSIAHWCAGEGVFSTVQFVGGGKTTANRRDAPQGFGNDVPLVVLIEKVSDRHAFSGWRCRRLSRVSARDDLADELRLPDLLGFLLRRNRLRRTTHQGERINWH